MGNSRKLTKSLDLIRDSLTRQNSLCFCLACYWFWQIFFFQSPLSFFGFSWGSIYIDAKLITLLSSCIVYVLMLRFRQAYTYLSMKHWYPGVLIAFLVGGTVLCLLAGFDNFGISHLVGIAGSVAIGIASALFLMELARIFAQLGPSYALSIGSLGTLISCIAFLICDFCGPVVLSIMCIAACIGFFGSWLKVREQFPRKRLYFWGNETVLARPTRLIITCAIQGYSLGLMSVLMQDHSHGSENSIIYIVSYAAGAFLVYGFASLGRMDYNHLLYQVGFPLMALGFLAKVWFPEGDLIPGSLFTAAYCFVYILITCICSYFSNCLKCSPIWIVSLTTIALASGQLLGMLSLEVPGVLAGKIPESIIEGISATFVYFLPSIALLLFSSQNTASGWRAIQPAIQNSTFDDQSIFAKIKSDYLLTERESVVLELLSRGRNKKRISESLGISEESVKTHMTNLYRKLNIHSQQEVIDLVEEERVTQNK